MKEITDYIDVYDATPADDRKNKIQAIADGLGVPPWEVAEQLKAAGCSVNLQWFNQLKRKAMASAESGAQSAETEGPPEEPAPDAAYLKKIIERQDKMLREMAEREDRLKETRQFAENRAKDLAERIHEKDGEIAALEAKLRQKDREIEELAGRLEEAGADDDHEEAFRLLHQNHEAAKKINAALRKELEEARDELAEQDARIRKYVDDAWEQDCRIEKLKKELAESAAAAEKEPARHFFGIEGGELDMADVINDFCGPLVGVDAYLCGRIIEALYCWRYNKTADPLRVLGGLVNEVIEMRTLEREAAE